MQVQAYLSFEGRCEEALQFYVRALDAKVTMLMRMQESPEPPPPGMLPPDSGNKVMHSTFSIGDTVLMATDGNCGGKAAFQGISLSLQPGSAAEAEKRFAALAEGGAVVMPLGKTFFAVSFGIVTDRFGVKWMVYVPQAM
jgi:PhnB protein